MPPARGQGLGENVIRSVQHQIAMSGRRISETNHLEEESVQNVVQETLPPGDQATILRGDSPKRPTAVPDFIEQTIAYQLNPQESTRADLASVQKTYHLGKEIARGGMGRIYSAEDPILNRVVAVKVVGTRDAEQRSQFLQEAKVLADLAHPNIVPIHNVGEDLNGQPFYSMKLIRGQTLQTIIEKLRTRSPETLAEFTLQRLLSIFQKACHAIAFAHAKGYLHRDIKPDNVMVGEYGEVLVMDWGLAQKIQRLSPKSETSEESSPHTRYVEGTPQYMSPEQAEGDALDERTDIYALGAVLFASLTLRAPVQGKSLEEVLSKVKRGELNPLISPRDDTHNVGLEAKRSSVPKALQAVVLKAMALKKKKRYASIEQLNEDIDAYLRGFATSAESASFGRLVWLFIGRHRVLSVVLALSMLGATNSAVRLSKSEHEAQANALRATEQARLALENAEQARAEKLIARRAAVDAQIAIAESAERDVAGEEMRHALMHVPEDLRDNRWWYLTKRLDNADWSHSAPSSSGFAECIGHPTQAHILLTLLTNGELRWMDVVKGTSTLIAVVEMSDLKSGMTLSSDRKRLALCRSLPKEAAQTGARARVEVWNLTSGQLEKSLSVAVADKPLVKQVALEFSTDSESLLMSSVEGGGVFLFDLKTEQLRWKREGDGRTFASFSSQTDVALLPQNGDMLLLSGATGKEVRSLSKNGHLTSPKNLHGSRRILAMPEAKSLLYLQAGFWRRIEVKSGNVLGERELPAGSRNWSDLAYLPNAKILVTISYQSPKSAILQAWDVLTQTLVREEPVLFENALTHNWKLVALPAADEVALVQGAKIKVWNLRIQNGTGEYLQPSELRGDAFAFLGDSSRVALLSPLREGRTRFTDVLDLQSADPKIKPTFSALNSLPDSTLSTNSDGKLLLVFSQGEGVPSEASIFGVEQNELSTVQTIKNIPSRYGTMSPNGKLLWTDKGLYNVANGSLLQEVYQIDHERLNETDETPRWIRNDYVAQIAMVNAHEGEGVPATRQICIQLWNAKNGICEKTLVASNALTLAPSPDGTQIAEGGSDMKVRIRDAQSLDELREIRLHDAPIRALAWHPTLPLLATASDDFMVKIVDLRTDTIVETIGRLSGIPDRLYWSPDGRTLAVRRSGRSENEDVAKAKIISTFQPASCSKLTE